MNLVEFQDYPSTETPLNAENLNYNFSHIVESGSNEKGSWTKWSDGTMICERQVDITDLNISAQWGTGLFYEYIQAPYDYISFPQPFIKKPTVSLELDWGDTHTFAFVLGCAQITNTYIYDVGLARGSAGTFNGTLHVIAKGKWK